MSEFYESVYRSQPDEHAFVATTIEGVVPPGLRGTLLRSGPGLLEVGADALQFFDGHTLLAGLTFDEGRCTFRSRFVRTPLYEAERAAGRMTKRRLFTNLPSRWRNLFALDLGNTAMHDVYASGGRVFAANDPGHFALDATTLATLGPESWSGAAPAGWEMAPMPSPDPTTGRLVAWLKKVGGTRPDSLKFVELDADLKVVKETALHPLASSPAIIHDQRATARWYVATEQAGRLAPLRALWGASTIWGAVDWPEALSADLLLVPREGGDRLVRVPLPGVRIAFHVINAFDEGDNVVVDLVTYDRPLDFAQVAPKVLRQRTGTSMAPGPAPQPRRFVIDPSSARVISSRPLGDRALEAPEVADARMGAPYRWAYGATDGPGCPNRSNYIQFGGVVKLDVDTGATVAWQAGPDVTCSPPAFVARPGSVDEDDGWLLAFTTDARGTSVVVLDAKAPVHGPVATIGLGQHLPGVSHVRFAPEVRLSGG